MRQPLPAFAKCTDCLDSNQSSCRGALPSPYRVVQSQHSERRIRRHSPPQRLACLSYRGRPAPLRAAAPLPLPDFIASFSPRRSLAGGRPILLTPGCLCGTAVPRTDSPWQRECDGMHPHILSLSAVEHTPRTRLSIRTTRHTTAL